MVCTPNVMYEYASDSVERMITRRCNSDLPLAESVKNEDYGMLFHESAASASTSRPKAAVFPPKMQLSSFESVRASGDCLEIFHTIFLTTFCILIFSFQFTGGVEQYTVAWIVTLSNYCNRK
jgi:hypothetical protein